MLNAIVLALSWKLLLFAFGLVTVFRFLRQKQIEENNIRRLGSKAPIVRSWLPLGE
jgi:vacuolar-type H+-ATPase subunit C/Vma6